MCAAHRCCHVLLEQVLAPAVVALALPMYLAAGLRATWHHTSPVRYVIDGCFVMCAA